MFVLIDICVYMYLFGLFLMLLFGVIVLWYFDYVSVLVGIWVFVVWYGLLVSIFLFWLWMKGIWYVLGSFVGVFSVVLLIVVAVYGIVFFGECLMFVYGVVFVCVVVGIVFVSLCVKCVFVVVF